MTLKMLLGFSVNLTCACVFLVMLASVLVPLREPTLAPQRKSPPVVQKVVKEETTTLYDGDRPWYSYTKRKTVETPIKDEDEESAYTIRNNTNSPGDAPQDCFQKASADWINIKSLIGFIADILSFICFYWALIDRIKRFSESQT